NLSFDCTAKIAVVSVVFPWSTWPIVPTFTCGFERSNLGFAIIILLHSVGQSASRQLTSLSYKPERRLPTHEHLPPNNLIDWQTGRLAGWWTKIYFFAVPADPLPPSRCLLIISSATLF